MNAEENGRTGLPKTTRMLPGAARTLPKTTRTVPETTPMLPKTARTLPKITPTLPKTTRTLSEEAQPVRGLVDLSSNSQWTVGGLA